MLVVDRLVWQRNIINTSVKKLINYSFQKKTNKKQTWDIKVKVNIYMSVVSRGVVGEGENGMTIMCDAWINLIPSAESALRSIALREELARDDHVEVQTAVKAR